MTTSAKPTEPPFHHFDPSALDEIVRRREMAGPGARFEVRQKGEKMFLRVVPHAKAHPTLIATMAALADINASHICPFDCPPPPAE